MTFNFQAIRTRVIALGLVACLGALALRQFVVLPQFEARLLEVVTSQQILIANYIARDIEHALGTRMVQAERSAAEAQGVAPNKLQEWIEQRQRANPSFGGGMLVVRADGGAVLAEYPILPGRAQRNFQHYPWFRKALQASKGAISQAAPAPHSAEPAILFTAPIRNREGKTVALLAAVALLSQHDFLDGFRNTHLGASGELMLVSTGDNLVIAASDPTMVMKPGSAAQSARWQANVDEARRKGSIAVNARGVEELSVMAIVPSTGWLVVARLPTSEALSPVGGMQRFLWSVTAAVFCGMLVLLTVGLGRILRPLVDTSNALRDMAEGKRPLAPLPVVRSDEVGQLVAGFNVLVDRLKVEEFARKAGEERLEFMAHHDSLTGLYNRAMLEDRLGLELARAERFGSQTALLFCDLDGFKDINDQHGHHAGDEVLCEVARRLSTLRRRADTVARLGGDEFVILLPDLKDARATAVLVAQQCLEAMRAPFEVAGVQCALGMSIGIAYHDGDVVAPSSLLDQADLAMYQAKRQGKGRYFFMVDIGTAVTHTAARGVQA